MFSLAFFALLRIGEITVNNNTRHVINKGDINVSQDLQVIKLTIPFSKTDQKGLSTTIAVSEFNQTAICPATLLSKYISVRHNENGPLFCHYNKNGVTRYQFTKVLHKALEFIGINPHDYNTHSFRIGSATYLSMNGFTEEHIKTKGHWKSASFQRYIHIESIINFIISAFVNEIWIIGSSIIDRAHQHSENRPTGCNLGLDNYNCFVCQA
jgi:hypothetical protein